MARCSDTNFANSSFVDQQRLGTDYYKRSVNPIDDFTKSRMINSFYPQAIAAKKKVITDFAACGTQPDDYLYFAAYTFDDKDIVDALIQARKGSNKTIKVLLDGDTWIKHKTSMVKPLVEAGLDVYIFNKDGSRKTTFGHPKLMHIKAITRRCGEECVTLISTANFTNKGKQEISHDLWDPSSVLADQVKKVIEVIINESTKIEFDEFRPQSTEGTPGQMGNKLIELVLYPDLIAKNIDEILRLIVAGADFTLARKKNGNFIAYTSSGYWTA
jgi:hypothetical protein